MVNLNLTYGALVLGGLISMFLAGIVALQVFLYHRTYPEDRSRNKRIVGVVWALDLIHTAFVCVSVFRYVTLGLANINAYTHILWTISVTISITGVLTFLVHCFFIVRVWTLSKHNRWLCSFIFVLAFARMISAFGTVIQIARFDTWKGFHANAAWLFTTGLAISATVDFVIAASLIWYLRRSRTGFASMDQIIDMIMAHTIENGLLTTMVTVASFICWLTMSRNFIFLAFHFSVSQLYANSLLATLNARARIKERSNTSQGEQQHSGYCLPTAFSDKSKQADPDQTLQATSVDPAANTLRICISKTVHCITEKDTGNEELESGTDRSAYRTAKRVSIANPPSADPSDIA